MKVLGLVGSLRRGSYNRGLLRAAQQEAPKGLEIDTFDIGALPFFDGDVERNGDPEAVAALKKAVRGADAVLFVTPEYNFSVPGVLKNALDWASRPPRDSALQGKPVAIMGAGGRSGTLRAQAHLRQMLEHPQAATLDEPVVAVPMAWEHFDENGELVDDEVRGQIRELLEALAARVQERLPAQVT